jgi:poly-gamma-glutamate system protein
MNKNYWAPPKTASSVLVLIALLALCGVGAVERFQTNRRQSYLSEKLAAAMLTRRAMEVVKAEHLKRNLPTDPVADPAGSGLIGRLFSPVTSNTGSLPAKRTSVNPNFAAVLVDMLKEAGVGGGDAVAVGWSGSFPAINISICAALQILKARPVVIASVSASQWGANDPKFLWVDMERVLYKQGVFRFRSIAASVGGIEDRGIGLPPEGLKLIGEAIKRNNLPLLDPQNYLHSVNQRMYLYREHAGGMPIKAYINVGGGTTSVGTWKGKKLFQPGVNLFRPIGPLPVDSVMARFAREGVPVIHLIQIQELAQRYGLPRQPTRLPQVGEGEVYVRHEYNRWLAAGVLVAILLSLSVPIRFSRPLSSDIVSWGANVRDEEPLI